MNIEIINWTPDAIGLDLSLAALPLLKVFNVTYLQTSDKRPNFLVIVGKDLEIETLESETYTPHSRPQLGYFI
jgi:hypothetical protein